MVTLDIEDSVIKIMVLKGTRVQVAASVELEPGLVDDGVILDRKAVSQHIRLLMDTHRITEKRVIGCISGIHSLYRIFKIPKLPSGLIEEAVKRETERVLPVSLDEVYTSWQAIRTDQNENVICLVGVPRNAVDAMMETLKLANLEARVLDVRPLAAARIANEKDALVVNIERNSFDIVIMLDGIPELLRSLAFPDQNMPVDNRMATIADEIERTIRFYNSSHRSNPIDTNIPTFVCGEGRDLLVQRLNYNIKAFPELLSYAEGFDISAYIVNIGLALKQLKVNESKLRLNINAVAREYLPKPKPVIEMVSMLFFVIAIVILVPMIIFATRAFKETLSLQEQVNSTRALIQAKQGSEEEVVKLHEARNKIIKQRDVFVNPLDNYIKQRKKVSDGLNAVTSSLPGTIVPGSISYEEKTEEEKTTKKFSVIGTATDEVTILQYSQALRRSGCFDQVSVYSIEVIDFNQVDFTFELK